MKTEEKSISTGIKPKPTRSFNPPADPKSTSGKCFVASRNSAVSPVNSLGFIQFVEKEYFVSTGEDLLYYIVKGSSKSNTLFFQDAERLTLYIFPTGLPIPNPTSAQLDVSLGSTIATLSNV